MKQGYYHVTKLGNIVRSDSKLKLEDSEMFAVINLTSLEAAYRTAQWINGGMR